MTNPVAVCGHCGVCGVSTDSLPCWSCELERRIQAAILMEADDE